MPWVLHRAPYAAGQTRSFRPGTVFAGEKRGAAALAQRPDAASSGPNLKAPGAAGGYLLRAFPGTRETDFPARSGRLGYPHA
jgi:hypothetical protein